MGWCGMSVAANRLALPDTKTAPTVSLPVCVPLISRTYTTVSVFRRKIALKLLLQVCLDLRDPILKNRTLLIFYLERFLFSIPLRLFEDD